MNFIQILDSWGYLKRPLADFRGLLVVTYCQLLDKEINVQLCQQSGLNHIRIPDTGLGCFVQGHSILIVPGFVLIVDALY